MTDDLFRAAMADVKPITDDRVPRQAPALRATRRSSDPTDRIDLHGMTVNEAHTNVLIFIADARLAGFKRVTIITGRSGAIREEFPRWMEGCPAARSWTARKDGGSFEVVLR